MKTDPQGTLVLQALEVARRVFEASGECPETVVPIRNGAANFHRQRVLGEGANDYARAASDLGAQAALVFGAKTFPGEKNPDATIYTLRCWLSHWRGVILALREAMDHRRRGEGGRDQVERAGPEPRAVPVQGAGWIPQE
jgi:hypothetical protein